jgi:hypothetical protein
MHFHSYKLAQHDNTPKLSLDSRKSTDVEGIGRCLGLQTSASVELADLMAQLESKISDETMFTV